MKQTMSKERVTSDDRIGEDGISLLPDHLLCKILSELPTKYAVRTSVLSKRWKSMWLSVPVLYLDGAEFNHENVNAVKSFVNRFLDISMEEPCIDKLKLSFVRDEDDTSYITQWIHNAVIRRVQHLDIGSYSSFVVSPLSLYTCETLVYLQLVSVVLADCEHISLPRLKTMVLLFNTYASDALLDKLISSCPVLEDLQVNRSTGLVIDFENIAMVVRVRSQSLKRLTLYLEDSGDFKDRGDAGYWEVLIDAPGLNYLRLTDNLSTSFLIRNNLSSSAKVDIDVTFDMEIISAASVSSKKSEVSKFFTGLLSVRDMTISRKTLKIICQHLKHEPLLQFPYMTRLHVKSSHPDLMDYDLEMLPNFLKSCPNLKSLVLETRKPNKYELVMCSPSVPECLRSSLEYIEMKRPIIGTESEMSLVKYLLENSSVLKKFKLHLGYNTMKPDAIILMELLRLRRCSADCEVVEKVSL